MSRRRSTGDLVPWDVTEVVGREVKAQRGHRKPGSSLGQAISWLRSSQKRKKKKTKTSVDNGGRQPAVADELQNQDTGKAGTKANDEQKKLAVHYSATEHIQENVFVEANRPQYLEDLHSEAQEGLKILQQEGEQEHESGKNFTEEESFTSSDTEHPEDDLNSKDEGGSLETKSNSGITDSTRNSSASTRPVLTRQGSTFKPLYPVKRFEKNKKRNRRTTIMGIPNQVQKELALHRGSTFQQVVSTQLHNHDSQPGVFIIPSVDRGTPVMTKEGAKVHLSDLEVSDNQEQIRSHLEEEHKTDEHFKHQGFGIHHYRSSVIRPKSVAVPGMTTFTSFNPLSSFLLEAQGPVMSVSPQATYLSTIIPNAVLPASIEVIEIDRGSQRGNGVNYCGSVHTVSKSSLASVGSSASPFLSRKSGGDGTHTDNSCNNSTTDGTTQKVDLNLQEGCVDAPGDQELTSPANCMTNIENIETSKDSEPVVLCASGDDAKIKRNSTRSLSIIKNKLPPAPPRRSNSLHINKFQTTFKAQADSKDANVSVSQALSSAIAAKEELRLVIAETSILLTPVSNPAEDNCHTSSVTQASAGEARKVGGSVAELNPTFQQKTPTEGEKFERTISPSSGYSSQSCTPTLSPKEIASKPTDKHKMTPVKPERSVSRASSSASPSSSLTSLSSGTSEPVNSDVSNSCTPTFPPASTKELTSHLRMEAKELWNLPPPPKVKAPCPPPPETWAQNSHTFALLCGLSPQVTKVLTDSTKTKESTIKHEGSQTETSEFCFEKQIKDNPVISQINSKSERLLCSIPVDAQRDAKSTECPDAEEGASLAKAMIETPEEQESCTLTINDSAGCDISTKKEPPPVMKKPLWREDKVFKDAVLTEGQQTKSCNITTTTTSVDETEDKVDTIEVASIPANFVENQNTDKSSPPPSPPPAYQPTPPLSRKSPVTSLSTSPVEFEREQGESRVVESSWPPPPPPLEGDSVFEGGDELDFPLPPPPDMPDNVPQSCATEMAASDTPVPPLEEFVKGIKDSSESETTSLPDPVLHQTVVCDNTDADASNGPLQTFSPALQNPSSHSITPAEIQPIVCSKTSSSFLKRYSLEIESHSASEPPITSQLPTLVTPSLPMENLTTGVSFRRPPSTAHRENRGKELIARHKSAPIPKEDANIPLVTPSLLQMVRLRTVNTSEDGAEALSEDKTTNKGALVQEVCRAQSEGQQNTPQKPTRKSLKSPPQLVKTYGTPSTPSMRLQEAIRIKTAAMSSREGFPCRLGMRPSYHCSSEPGMSSLKSSEALDTQRIPASTASFIFSRSSKRAVIDTGAASSDEEQAGVKQSLAPEIVRFSEQMNTAPFPSGGVKSDRVPPPVARKPSQASISFPQDRTVCAARTEPGLTAADAIGPQQYSKGIALPETTTRVTADTIETLF
ncbi:uncharacterized protein KIAA1522 homolog isoform X2 [Syngnathoides biaculeatus]|uniref:uncharacterized protein KIAA1522 homolog isoform X2 n=1 Tax=Syngnathoides biaculeatus TaxID=300417 RepID=UPI002ADE73D8|nr:uncharacterized protein KIAA1522 homolog isoform X2 [Syngnathoides biaculeatus]